MQVKILLQFFFQLIFSLPFCIGDGYKSIVYPENKFPSSSPIRIYYYSEGTVVLELEPYIPPNSYPNRVLRVFSANGTLNSFEVKNPTKGISIDLGFYPLSPGYLFLVYTNTSIPSEPFFYPNYGMLVSLDGRILQNDLDLGISNQYSNSLTTNTEPDQNFMWSTLTPKHNEIRWTVFQAPSPKNQALTKICGGIILTTLNITSHASFPTVDGGYGVAFIVEKAGSSNKTTINPYTKGIARNVIISAYVTFLDPNATKFGQNFLIYTTSQPAAREGLRFCFPKVLGNGFECTVGDDRISFLRNGAVIDITHLETRDQINRPLPYGGILVDTHVTDLQNFSSALIYDDNGNPKQQWPFPVSKGYLYNFMYDILPNNTFWGAYKELHSNNITLYIQDVPKFFKDNGYNNPMIESTTPPRNSKVSLESKLISVKYIQPITTSIKNISIYQFKGADPILRQTFPSQSQYCSLSDDQKSINIKVLSSTFNQPNGSYFVIIDNNFVKTRLLDEPLFGIKKNDWIITRDEEENVFAGSFTGLVRLTPDGSKFFRGLSTNAAREFINQLKVELAQTIPVDISRISTSDQHQEDPSSPFSQTLLKFTILSTQDSSQPNSFKLSQDLKTLIENKGITQLSLNPQSSLLDSDFGFRSTPNIWENLKLKIIILGVFIIFLLIVYILARRRFPEGNNFALINQVLVLFDLAMDVTFILYNGKDVKSLFLPSIIILAVVVTFNSGLAVYILVNEIKRNKNCVDWFQEYTKPAAMITLTSAANIESLKLLSSRFAGLKIFSLPLSPTAIQLIFWGGFINLFLEDIPQLIIQILYYNWSISYDIIPFLSLVTAVLSVLCNIIGRIYYLIIELYVKPNTFSRKIANYNDTLTLEEEQRSPILLDPQYTEPMD